MTAVNLRLLLGTMCYPRRTLTLAAVASQKSAFRGKHNPCNFDFVVVGGGMVGLATARELLERQPCLKLALIEKECHLAKHQSNLHPGLIHSGLLYDTDTKLPELCIRGAELLNDFCKKMCIPMKRSGKIILALDREEDICLEDIIANAVSRQIPNLRILSGACAIREVEPYAVGVRALHLPEMRSVDWRTVSWKLAQEIECRGGRIFKPFEVEGFAINCCGEICERKKYPVCVFGHNRFVNTSYAIVCAGIFSDRFAKMTCCDQTPLNISLRGHYLALKRDSSHLVKGNIYLIPDTSFPYMGPNATRRYDGCVLLGPNLIPASKREGYKVTNMSCRDMFEAATYRGFWNMHPRIYLQGFKGLHRQFRLKNFVNSCRCFLPSLTPQHVKQWPYPIVFPMPVRPSGKICNDLCLEVGSRKSSAPEVSTRVLHCRTVPEPAATMCMAIAEVIVDKVEMDFFKKKPGSKKFRSKTLCK